MPGFIKTKEQERLWQKAQDIAEKAGKKDDWAYVTGIYKKMNGGKVAVEAVMRVADRHLQAATATEMYARYMREIQGQLKRIEQGLVKHAAAEKRSPLDWGNAGDLENIKALLERVREALNA